MGDQAEIDRLREEVSFWRKDCAARLCVATGLLGAASTEPERARIRVNQLFPTLAAWDAAKAGEWHPATCEDCGNPLINGQRYFPIEDSDGMHVDCKSPNDAPEIEGSFTFDDGLSDEQIERIVSKAREAFCA